MIAITKYICQFCGSEFSTEKDALMCESLPIPPEFDKYNIGDDIQVGSTKYGSIKKLIYKRLFLLEGIHVAVFFYYKDGFIIGLVENTGKFFPMKELKFPVDSLDREVCSIINENINQYGY